MCETKKRRYPMYPIYLASIYSSRLYVIHDGMCCGQCIRPVIALEFTCMATQEADFLPVGAYAPISNQPLVVHRDSRVCLKAQGELSLAQLAWVGEPPAYPRSSPQDSPTTVARYCGWYYSCVL